VGTPAQDKPTEDETLTSYSLSPQLAKTTFKRVDRLRKALEIIESALPATEAASFEEYTKPCLDTMISTVQSVQDENDIEAILNLIPVISPQCYYGKYVTLGLVIPFANSFRVLGTLAYRPQRAHLAPFFHKLYQSASVGIIPRSIAKETYERLLPGLSTAMKIPDAEFTPEIAPGPVLAVSDYSLNVLSVLEHSLQLGLEHVSVHLIKTVLPDLTTRRYLEKHWKQILDFVKRLVAILQRERNEAATIASRTFISVTLRKIVRALTQSFPRPRNWVRKTGNCSCGPCKALNQFLADGFKEIGRFSYAERTRRHRESHLPEHRDFNVSTERLSTPYTLVIQKTHRGYEREQTEWNTHFSQIQARFNNMQTPFLKELLGEGHSFDELYNDPERVASTQTLQPVSRSAQNARVTDPGVGAKRKLGIIDLTDDLNEPAAKESRR